MEAGVPNSFIPQDATSNSKPIRRYESGGLSELVSLIATILLVASIALAAGAFIYNQYLQTQVAGKLKSIQNAQQQFDPTLVQQLTQLDNRMQTAQGLLSSHLAPSAFLAALNQSTLQTISFTTLDYEAPDNQHVSIKMTGVAQSVNSIAEQAQLFGQSGVLENPIFSDVDPQIDGVHFNLTADVNPSALSYEQYVQNGQAGAQDSANGQPTQTSQSSVPPTATTSVGTAPAAIAPSSVVQSTQSTQSGH